MIYGSITAWHKEGQYFPAIFDKAFAFLRENDSSSLADGKYLIDGENLFALIGSMRTEDENLRRFEAHVDFLDIQLLLSGREKHLYAVDAEGLDMTEDLLEERDLAFYSRPAQYSSLILAPGHYGIYFPGELHCPCCAVTPGGEEIRKIIFKIRWTS